MAKSLSQHLLKVRWKQPYDSIPEVLPELRKVGDIAAPQDFIEQVATFMAVLEIDYKDVPSHRHITDINIRRLLEELEVINSSPRVSAEGSVIAAAAAW